ncbi:Krr1-domain-containing protein [Sporormia fimetaria CBS 119925]|uniref:Krr1-domain-containing protein n=1 Tax=Sporormia fimetaria CBS 119925 TaxID=1340428 RepID=A0A6A6UXL5_9PLEO|nr:Krr1-domain-containing protein [Sporormia fimetaria CBS 119925]
MAKDKTKSAVNGVKHARENGYAPSNAKEERPVKKAKLLDDSDDDGEDNGGVGLKINEEYAKRFEHNKKRAERHRLEEKYGKNLERAEEESETDSEEDVSEDDDGELVTEDLDAAISETLNAIRSKDPRVYNAEVRFFKPIEEETEEVVKVEKEKPMTLKDYHTKNLLEGKLDLAEEEDTPVVRTHQQELDAVRQDALKAIQEADADEEEEEDDFLVAKSRPETKKNVKITEEDVENADKDPETFLSNFMAARAWKPTDESHWKPLESEDEEEIERAEEYENAYNMYFENPAGQNEKLVTYARDAVANTTVRREDKSARAKAREAARAKREAERRQREEELARLRKLRVEEMEEKAQQIRKLGGFKDKEFKVEEFADILEAEWSDDKWDEEMRKRFGDAYYDGEEEEESEGEGKRKKKPKKPKFDDDIDITDIVPDFDDSVPVLTDDEENDADGDVEMGDVDDLEAQPKSSKQRKKEREEAKSAARRDRRIIEKLVDANLEFEAKLATASKKHTGGFRYRETSPTTFGLTPRDILLASDAQLNEFAGLKKLATFRDPAKKKKDKKHLSKKARLRQWRLDTFGDEDGPRGGFELLVGDEEASAAPTHRQKGEKGSKAGELDIREGDGDGKKKKKRSRKRKAETAVEA